MFQQLDDKIRRAATKFAHGLQRATGLTSYFLARIGVLLAAFAIVIETVNYFHQFLLYKTTTFDLCIAGPLIALLGWRSIIITKAEESIGSNSKPSILMPYLTESYFWRITWVVFTLMDILISCLIHSPSPVYETIRRVGFSSGITIFSYFILIDPLPPGTSKIREWISGLFHVPQVATQESNS